MRKPVGYTNKIIIISLCLVVYAISADILPIQFQLASSPLITNSGSENVPICFADCDSCQRNGDCEICFGPFFILSEGKCVKSSQYILQSTEQEQRFTNFIPSSQWFYNQTTVATTRVCSPDSNVLSRNFTILGPFSSGTVNYQRTLSQHNYFAMKFLLILSNWSSTAQIQPTLRIRVSNQAGTLIANKQLTLSSDQIKNAYRQRLCSPNNTDIKVSVKLLVNQEQTSQIFMQFNATMDPGVTWGISSFVLLTGSCNQKCQSCRGYTSNLQGCLACRNYLTTNASGQKCSTCLNGFSLNRAQNRCFKCPIEYKQCRFNEPPPDNLVSCQFSNISNVQNSCILVNSSYFDRKDLTEQTFFGSLYIVQNRGANVTRCGYYSVVGPASFGGIISRNIVQLPPHIEMSINLNLFIFDQSSETERYTIVILVDGVPIQFEGTQQTINITGTSNQCDLSPPYKRVQAMRTFQTQKFIKHRKTDNVDIRVSLGTSSPNPGSWGVRDIRLVFKRCDQNCESCTQFGCQRCRGFFQLVNLQCQTCMIQTGLSTNKTTCIPCPQNCIECNFTLTKTSNGTVQTPICVRCNPGFYLYNFKSLTTCEKNPNFGDPIGKRISQTPGCPLVLGPNKNLNFDVVNNNARSNFVMPTNSTRKSIQFYLMKMGDWEGDYLDIYSNDLLVKRLKLGNQGSTYCGVENSNDSMTFHQFQIQDNNSTVSLEFQAVRNDPNKIRQFAVSNLSVFPVGCPNCKNYNFNYKTKYNYDERLFAELAFNLVYQNKNPQQFKNIFRMKVGQKQLKYDITANDSIRYWLRSQRIDPQQILDRNVSIECLYPQRVTTQIPTFNSQEQQIPRANQFQFFNGTRLLQAQNRFQNTKTLDNNFASVNVDRYTPLGDQESGVLGSQTFFSILTRFIIYTGFASFFIGCQTPCTHVMHNFQKLWVHIYVASLALSPVLKTALWGFRESQDQNIAVNPDQWQSGLPKYLYYDAPAQYQHYYKDITFFRHIYNVGVAFAILCLVYAVLYCLLKGRRPTNSILQHLRNTFVHRPIWYFNSIIFYQYFTVVIACCLQFLDLKTRTNEPTFAGVNAAGCIIAFIFATLYPIIFHLLLNRKRNTMMGLFKTLVMSIKNNQYQDHLNDLSDLEEQHVIYNNKYSQIFYRFLPKKLWNANLPDSDMISEKHYFYNIFRFGDLWWHAIVVILLHYSPFAQAFLLVLTNGFHLALNVFSRLNTNKYFRIFKSLELVFFIVIEVMIIVMHSLLKTLRTDSYKTLGIVTLIFVYFIVAVTFIRFFYTLYRLIKEYRHTSETDIHSVVRQDKGFFRGWLRDPRINTYN